MRIQLRSSRSRLVEQYTAVKSMLVPRQEEPAGMSGQRLLSSCYVDAVLKRRAVSFLAGGDATLLCSICS